jgi:hypothetical protein
MYFFLLSKCFFELRKLRHTGNVRAAPAGLGRLTFPVNTQTPVAVKSYMRR